MKDTVSVDVALELLEAASALGGFDEVNFAQVGYGLGDFLLS